MIDCTIKIDKRGNKFVSITYEGKSVMWELLEKVIANTFPSSVNFVDIIMIKNESKTSDYGI